MNFENKEKIVKQTDLLMWITLAMFIIMRVSVLLVFNITATETGAEIEAVHTAYEANPIFKAFLSLKMVGYILQFLVIPAIGFAVYWLLRRKVLYDEYDFTGFQFHTLFLFFLVLFNFVNDVTALVGRII